MFFACLAPKYDKPTAWSASPQVLGSQFAKPPIYLYADSGHHLPFEVIAYLSLACNLVILFACFTHQFSVLPPRMADTTACILPTWLPSSVFNATRILGYFRFTQLHRPSRLHQPKFVLFYSSNQSMYRLSISPSTSPFQSTWPKLQQSPVFCPRNTPHCSLVPSTAPHRIHRNIGTATPTSLFITDGTA